MGSKIPIDLKFSPEQQPTQKFVGLILSQAIWDRADKIVFELNQEAASNPFRIVFRAGETESEFAPPPASLFEPVTRAILSLAEIPYWKKGDVAGEFETQNPRSKWKVISSDVTRLVCLERVVESNAAR